MPPLQCTEAKEHAPHASQTEQENFFQPPCSLLRRNSCRMAVCKSDPGAMERSLARDLIQGRRREIASEIVERWIVHIKIPSAKEAS